MPLHYIPPNQLPTVWDKAAPLLQKSIDTEPDFITIEQVEYAMRTGKMFLLVWEEPDEGITGAAAVEFIDYPRYRVGHGTLLARLFTFAMRTCAAVSGSRDRVSGSVSKTMPGSPRSVGGALVFVIFS